MRNKLSDRRMCKTIEINHKPSEGDTDQKFLVTFGFDDEWTVREVFCADRRVGSDMHALITDSCILISIYLQTGGEPERLVRSLGENRNEGEDRGRPSSVLGSVARAILDAQREMRDELNALARETQGPMG